MWRLNSEPGHRTKRDLHTMAPGRAALNRARSNQKSHWYLSMTWLAFLSFGASFCYDAPAALTSNFKNDSKMKSHQFGLLYSAYSWPSVITCFVGGYLLDRWNGITMGTKTYMTVITTGTILFSYGVYINSFWLMLLGRFTFGIGGESLQAAVNKYVLMWFRERELNTVFTLLLSFSLMGNAVNYFVMESFYKWSAYFFKGHERLGGTLFIAAMACVITFSCALVLGRMDRTARRGRRPMQVYDDCIAFNSFQPVFWLICLTYVTYYLAILPFIAYGKLYIERKFHYLPQGANMVVAMIYLVSAILSPLFGIVLEKFGKNVSWLVAGVLIGIIGHAQLAFTFHNPYYATITLGISYTVMASSFKPLMKLLLPEQQLTMAYSIYQSLQNVVMALVMIVTGVTLDKFGYIVTEIFYILCLLVSLMAGLLVYIGDFLGGGILNMSQSRINAYRGTTKYILTLKY